MYRPIDELREEMQKISDRGWKRAQENFRVCQEQQRQGTHDVSTCPWHRTDMEQFEKDVRYAYEDD